MGTWGDIIKAAPVCLPWIFARMLVVRLSREEMMSRDRGDLHWHALDESEMMSRLRTGEDGLSADEAARRLDAAGRNTLQGQEGIHPAVLLLTQFHNPLMYLLFGALALSVAAGHVVDAGVIGGVIILNALLGFVEEWRAEGALAALRQMSAPLARVRRGGRTEEIDAAQVVPGDLLVLETGHRVAADARVLSSEELEADESALTGESDPVAKRAGRVERETAVADRNNMVWMSTPVTGGRGLAVVVETGARTQMGRIASEVSETGREKTPLQKRMSRLGLVLGIAGVALGGAVFALGLVRGRGVVEMLLFSVAVAVSAIPEGLPAVISVTLALGVRRMADRGAIIRRLPAVETLGSTTVICTDKTGTLTMNQMTVERLWAGGRRFRVTGEGYEAEGRILDDGDEPVEDLPGPLELLLRIGALCNNAELAEGENGRRVDGDPSEGALLVLTRKAGLEPEDLAERYPRRHEIPFSSDARYMATVHDTPDGGRWLLVKGAPERVLSFCSRVLMDDKPREMDDELRRKIAAKSEALAGEAYRVLACGFKEVPRDADKPPREEAERGLTFVGLWGMMDPPRGETMQAVADTAEAGIRTVLITGDHATTALAVARKVGITKAEKALSADDVERLEKRPLAERAIETAVIARVAPKHKLKITEALKDAGHVVAMTGDGVNDAPALKGADIGVAMGKSGTEVAKEAADMVLTDDNFATIVHAVEEGRTIYLNLQRVVFFLLATNLGEVLTLIMALILGLDLPLTAVMILWINLVTDGACTIPLGLEPRHQDVLKHPPRDPRAPILGRPMILRVAVLTPLMAIGTLGLFAWYQEGGRGLAYSRSVAFAVLAAFQWFQAFNARSHYLSILKIGLVANRWLLLGVGMAAALQIIVIQTPLGQSLFGTAPLSWTAWLLVVGVAASIWAADEILKALGAYGRPHR